MGENESKDIRSGAAAWRSFLLILGWGAAAAMSLHFRQGWAPIARPDFQSVSPRAWSVVLFCVSVAALTMGFVQICRMILPVRGLFHRRALIDWLGTEEEEKEEKKKEAVPPSPPAPAATGTAPPTVDVDVKVEKTPWEKVLALLDVTKPDAGLAIAEFEERRGVRSEKKTRDSIWSFVLDMSLYDLPIEQLSGQLNLAFEAALDDPKQFKHFILLTVGREGAENLLTIVEPPPEAPVSRDNPEMYEFEKKMVARGQSRSAVSRTSQLRIDMFQISTGGRWRFLLRSVVLLVSIALSFGILCTTTADVKIDGVLGTAGSLVGVTANLLISLVYAILFGSIAAYLAMFLRDLAAIVENKRRRTS